MHSEGMCMSLFSIQWIGIAMKLVVVYVNSIVAGVLMEQWLPIAVELLVESGSIDPGRGGQH